MTPNFSEFDLQPQLVQTIADIGYAAPTPIQSSVIPAMLAGKGGRLLRVAVVDASGVLQADAEEALQGARRGEPTQG